ncbi:hypothetical protein ROHU_018750 [Labeo rohita]|uniref:Uncharacterized protein n=1 Tax=Labeo rohita TaxID=84645 RepID=A0A498N820_LABRO|nr:hypothetical protein ROHU_018750 [Labeo rohita]
MYSKVMVLFFSTKHMNKGMNKFCYLIAVEVRLSCRGAGISRVDSCGPSCQRDICRADSEGYCDGTQGLGSRNDRQGIKNGTIRMQRHTSMPIILICSRLKTTE